MEYFPVPGVLETGSDNAADKNRLLLTQERKTSMKRNLTLSTLALTIALASPLVAMADMLNVHADLTAASDGPSAAHETLIGAALAESSGWTAPAMPEHPELPPVPEKK